MEKKESISILGCGWLGLPLAKSLIEKSYQVSGSTTTELKLAGLQAIGIKPFQIIMEDTGLKGNIDEFLASEILIINIPPGRKPESPRTYPVLFEQLKKKIEESLVKKVIFISTTSVYQDTNAPVNEKTTPHPSKASGVAKLAVEQLLQSSTAYKTTILRFAGLIGPGRNPGRFLAGKNDLPGGEDPVNLIHLEDCIGIIETVIEKRAWGNIFNGCCPHHPAKKDFYPPAAVKSGLTPPVFNGKASGSYKIIDGNMVEKSLGYRYKITNLFAL